MDALLDLKNTCGDFCSHWHLFCLVSVILSIHRNVTNEVGLKLVDVVNHCWLKEFKIAIVITLACQGVHCNWHDVMILEKTVLFWLSELNDKLTISLKDISEIEKESFFCWTYNE